MKYIFDFDDVIFHTTRHRKERMFPLIEKAGISRKEIEEYYAIARENLFSLKKMLAHFLLGEDLYASIMDFGEDFLNKNIIEKIKNLGKDNCYLVTFGDGEYNQDKILRSDVIKLFHKKNIFIVSGSKKEKIEQICEKHRNEEIIFIDDKEKEFADLDFHKFPNLKTILYTGQKF